MKTANSFRGATLMLGAAFLISAQTPGFAAQEGLYFGVSAGVEEFDVSTFKTLDNTPEGNMSLSQGKIFTERASDTKSGGGFGIAFGYQRPIHYLGDMYWSGEINLTYHSGKARGRIKGAEDAAARKTYNDANDPDLPAFSAGPQVGENWPETWTFEKDYSYGVTFRLGGRPDFLTSAFGPDSGLYVLAGARRVEAEYVNTGTGCFKAPSEGYCVMDDDFEASEVRTDRDYTAWMLGVGMHAAVAEKIGLQIESYYMDYGSEDLVQLDGMGDLRVRSTHELEAEEIGLRMRLLRYF